MVSRWTGFLLAVAGTACVHSGFSQKQPSFPQKQPTIEYAVLQDDRSRIDYYKPSEYSSIIGDSSQACQTMPEDCLVNAFVKRYNEITERYLEARNKPASVALGIADGFPSTSSHVPKINSDGSIPLRIIYETPMKKEDLELSLSRATGEAEDKPWTLLGVPFESGEYMITPYFARLPFHKIGDVHITDNDRIVIEKYSNGSLVLIASQVNNQDCIMS